MPLKSSYTLLSLKSASKQIHVVLIYSLVVMSTKGKVNIPTYPPGRLFNVLWFLSIQGKKLKKYRIMPCMCGLPLGGVVVVIFFFSDLSLSHKHLDWPCPCGFICSKITWPCGSAQSVLFMWKEFQFREKILYFPSRNFHLNEGRRSNGNRKFDCIRFLRLRITF